MGEYLESKSCYEKALPIYYKRYGKNHIETICLLVHLGSAYRELGQFMKARHCYEQSISAFKRYHNQDDIKIAWSLGWMGTIYNNLGYYKDYEKMKKLCK